MPNRQFEQHSYDLGEISKDHLWRSELQVRSRSLKSARNVRPTVGGTAEARPGTRRIGTLTGDGIIANVTIAGTVYMLVFTANRLEIWDKASRIQVQAFGGMVWTAPIITRLVVAPHGSKIYVAYNTIRPQVITRADDGTWSVADYAFTPGIGLAISQPYYRYARPGVTLTPSGQSGTITLTSSADYFLPSGHVGLRLRLQGREVLITGYTSPTVVTADVVNTLFPTVSVPVVNSGGFQIGELVSGKDSGVSGEVVGIPDSTHVVILKSGFTPFYNAVGGGELMIGVSFTTQVNGDETIITPAPVLDWAEQAMSDIRGWPGTVVVHRNRLWFASFQNIPFGIAASAVGDHADMEVGAGDADAIFEEIGDEGAGLVRHLVSAEQLLVLTSRQAFYYPESEANPIKPSSFQLLRIGPDGASTCRPVLISEGVLFGESGGGSVLGAFPTGDVRRSWRIVDMSRFAAHLISTPRCIAYVSGTIGPTVASRTIRYGYAVNENGTLAVISYTETDADALPGWTPWDTRGTFRWATAVDGECWAIVRRLHASTVVYSLEVFDPTRAVDASITVTVADLLGPASSEVIQTPSGPTPADLVYRCPAYANATCSLVIGGDYIGEVTLNASGDFGAPDLSGEIELGFVYPIECVPWPPMDTEDQRARRRKRRITGVIVRYEGKGIAVNGKLRPLYDADEDTSQPAPVRDETRRWPGIGPGYGWQDEPTATISRPYAGPFILYGTSLEVAT